MFTIKVVAADAEKLYREVSVAQQKILGPDNVDTLRSRGDLGATLSDEGQYVEGEKLLREVLDSNDGCSNRTPRNIEIACKPGRHVERPGTLRRVREIRERGPGDS